MAGSAPTIPSMVVALVANAPAAAAPALQRNTARRETAFVAGDRFAGSSGPVMRSVSVHHMTAGVHAVTLLVHFGRLGHGPSTRARARYECAVCCVPGVTGAQRCGSPRNDRARSGR